VQVAETRSFAETARLIGCVFQPIVDGISG